MSNIAARYSKESIAHRRRQEVACPRCMEPCGWCSDPRWMHGTLNLPGTSRKCGVPGYEPEGAGCPVCHGRQRVQMTQTFEPLTKTSSDLEPKSSAGLAGTAHESLRNPTEQAPPHTEESQR